MLVVPEPASLRRLTGFTTSFGVKAPGFADTCHWGRDIRSSAMKVLLAFNDRPLRKVMKASGLGLVLTSWHIHVGRLS